MLATKHLSRAVGGKYWSTIATNLMRHIRPTAMPASKLALVRHWLSPLDGEFSRFSSSVQACMTVIYRWLYNSP
jgi:hypothetical protein